MFDLAIQELDLKKENFILKKNINLDENLDCFMLISCKNKALAENSLNHIIENIIDKISVDDTYNDFGIALENINAFLKNWKKDNSIEEEKENRLDIIISILNKNSFMFSNIGKTVAYMINSNSEIVELTEKGENKKEFLYISSGDLANGDIIITSTINLLKYLSKSDIKDSMILTDDMEIFGKNIKNILKTEIVKKNCLVSCLKYRNEFIDYEDDKLAIMKNFFVEIADKKLPKKIIGYFLFLKDRINTQSKRNKNIAFIMIIIISIVLLYFLVSKFLGGATKTEVKEEVKNSIQEIEKIINIASENVQNSVLFTKNIKNAEDMIKELESTNLFKGDISRLNDEIDILKNQFNKVEIFKTNADNAVYTEKIVDPILVAKEKGKTYIITKKGVVGPIIGDKKAKVYIFSDLKKDEEFIDLVFIGNNIFLLTNNSKIVRFSPNNGSFSFTNVSSQSSWEEMKTIESYSSNLYTLGKDSQIYRHKTLNSSFSKQISYLKKDDIKNLGNIIDFSIDGGFYLVKENLEVLKFFRDPYRLESLFLNKLPENYKKEKGTIFKIKSGYKLNYVYMLLNNKIWVFKTNSKNYLNTTNLTYLGQIEGESSNKTIDFFVENDGNILVLNEKGIFKLSFEVSNDKVIVR